MENTTVESIDQLNKEIYNKLHPATKDLLLHNHVAIKDENHPYHKILNCLKFPKRNVLAQDQKKEVYSKLFEIDKAVRLRLEEVMFNFNDFFSNPDAFNTLPKAAIYKNKQDEIVEWVKEQSL